MSVISLPPLRAVQTFEAVGRRGSVTAAAEELGITPGAVTQQIRSLERHLKLRLLQRQGRGIRLTSWGTVYLPHATAALGTLRTGVQQLERTRLSNHLTVSALPSVANKWLGPLLFEWKKLNLDVSIMLDGVHPEPGLEDGDADFRVSYGSRSRAHQRYSYLFTDYLIPVGSPTLGRAADRADPGSLLRLPLLGIDWGSEFASTPSWRHWFASLGLPTRQVPCDLTFSLSSAAIDAAIEGRGLVLAQHSMVATALRSGSLVRLSDHCLVLPEAYFLAWSAGALDKPLGAAFRDWLTAEARRFELLAKGSRSLSERPFKRV